ncbi:hypothetical protein [Cellulosilyticum ruminicola]|uniref:hypothetical protein n=1 Tax=Cellulosilyticum ruminicola TaxID=425254 RepID=UPI0006D0DFC5|nr:hypothetical protein [Cellulosilyticum ruminicola]
MSDQSTIYFPNEKHLKEYLKQLEKKGLKYEDVKIRYDEALEKRQKAVLKGMKQAIEKDGYTLLVEDIAKLLDIDEKHVRFNVIPEVDYIVAPQGAVEYFTLEHRPDLHFLEMQVQKWKRIFINEASFYRYLKEYLYVCCPYSQITWNESFQKYECTGENYIEIPYDEKMASNFIRSCNIAHIIKIRKREELFKRTEKEIVKARALGLISQNRLEQEMGYLREQIDQIQFVVSTQEIKQFLKKNSYQYYQLRLYKKDKEGNKVKSTVFYCFENITP